MKIVLGCDLFPYFGIVFVFLPTDNSSITDLTHLFLQYWTPAVPLASCSEKELLCSDPRLDLRGDHSRDRPGGRSASSWTC